MYCAGCGTDNEAAAKFCKQCGGGMAALVSPPAPVDDMRLRHPLASQGPGHGGASVALQVRSPGTAVLLSALIIGAGQLYNNDFKKAAVMFVAAIGGAMFTMGFGTVGVWVWGMVDAHQVASGRGKIW
jgi:hypothetical protein